MISSFFLLLLFLLLIMPQKQDHVVGRLTNMFTSALSAVLFSDPTDPLCEITQHQIQLKRKKEKSQRY